MRVYIEVVLFNNLVLDLLLVLTCLYVRHRKVSKIRVVISVLIGAAASVGYVFIPLVWQIVTRALLAPFMSAIFDKHRSFKDYAVSLAVFVLLTFALGGTVVGINNLVGVELRGYGILGLVALGAVILEICIVAICSKRAKTKRTVKTVTLGYRGKCVNALALYDSGNTLTDILTGEPVVVISESLKNELGALDNNNNADIEGYINVETVSGESNMPLIKLDGVHVDGKSLSAYAALAHKNFDGFDLILQNTMFGG